MGKRKNKKKANVSKKFINEPSQEIANSLPRPNKPRLTKEELLWRNRIREEYRNIIYKTPRTIFENEDPEADDINLLWNRNTEAIEQEVKQKIEKKPIEGTWDFNPPPEPLKKKGRKRKRTLICPIVTIDPVKVIPKVNHWTWIKRNETVEDETEMYNMPFLGDDVIEKEEHFIDEVICTYESRHGDENQDLMTDEILIELINVLNALAEKDEILKNMTEAEREIFLNIKIKIEDSDEQGDSDGDNGYFDSWDFDSASTHGGSSESKKKKIQTIAKFPSNQIIKSMSKFFTRFRNPAQLRNKIIEICKDQPGFVIPSEFIPTPNIDGPEAESLPREKTLGAFHKYFCRRCYIYGCTLHRD